MDKSIKKSSLTISENGLEKKTTGKRLEVLKTYKIYIGGQFPRTESGRYYVPVNAEGKKLANVCLSSRKDFRDAVVSARGAFSGWSGRAAFNRGQVLYRMAEMLEGRKAQFIEELTQQDASKAKAEKEDVVKAIMGEPEEEATQLPIIPTAVRFVIGIAGAVLLVAAFVLVFSTAIALLRNGSPNFYVPTIEEMIKKK